MSPLTSIELSFLSIARNEHHHPQLVAEWDAAMSGHDPANRVDYHFCEYDVSQSNDCHSLAMVTDEFSVKVPVDSLISAASKNYFILAQRADDSVRSTQYTLSNYSITKAMEFVKASNTGRGDQFGFSTKLSADGKTLAVGAPDEDGDGSVMAQDSGAVYLFAQGDDGRWTQTAQLKAANTQPKVEFGFALALSADGKTLAVGAPKQGVDGKNSGGVYLFENKGEKWQQTAHLQGSNTHAGDYFGFALAFNADATTLAVGSPADDAATKGINNKRRAKSQNSGAVYLFKKAHSQWQQSAYIKASNTGEDDQFGYALALNTQGNTLAIGAPFEDSDSLGSETNGEDSGAVYLFESAHGNWSQTEKLKASSTRYQSETGSSLGALDQFGSAVALDGAGITLAIGTPNEDVNIQFLNQQRYDFANKAGAVYVFRRHDQKWHEHDYLTTEHIGENEGVGFSLALSADGQTLATGSHQGHTGTDEVHVFKYDTGSWSQVAYLEGGAAETHIFSETTNSEQLGFSVTLSADGKRLAAGAISENSSAIGINGEANQSASKSGAVFIY
jgi:hypothetical protein